jgi:hypothetical protein
MNEPKMLAVLMLSAVAPLWATTYVPMQLTVTPTEQILRIELIETNYVIETLEIEHHDDLIFGTWSEAARLTDTAPETAVTEESNRSKWVWVLGVYALVMTVFAVRVRGRGV